MFLPELALYGKINELGVREAGKKSGMLGALFIVRGLEPPTCFGHIVITHVRKSIAGRQNVTQRHQYDYTKTRI